MPESLKKYKESVDALRNTFKWGKVPEAAKEAETLLTVQSVKEAGVTYDEVKAIRNFYLEAEKANPFIPATGG